MSKNFSQELLLIFVLFIILVLIGIGTMSAKPAESNLHLAKITVIGNLENDGGFFYQNVTAEIVDPAFSGQNTFSLRIQLEDPDFEKILTGTYINVKRVPSSVSLPVTPDGESSSETPTFIFTGYSRGNTLFWLVLLFLVFLLVMLGVEGFKYILPSLLMVIWIVSGNLTFSLHGNNIYLASFAILMLLAFFSIYLQAKNFKIAIIVVISQAVTLFLILLINLVLFEKLFLNELYYENLNVRVLGFAEYWSLLNVVVVFISFGAVINATLDVVKGMTTYKQNIPGVTNLGLIKEGTRHHQIAIARIINVLFFVFLGLMLINLLYFSREKYLNYWDDPNVVFLILLFINSASAALLVGPVSAIITAVFINTANRNNGQITLKN
ncbi:MAG TPA: YibE/F family protein [Candidatus Dojkabacteria bacterium]|nr:YibE/F family protein [Candidatus Dojkabacteria bacterium]